MSEATRVSRERFEALNLADCRLVGVHLPHRHGHPSDTIELDLLMVVGESADRWRPARLRFLKAASVDVRIDFWAKEGCGDVISSTTCHDDAPSIKAALHEYNAIRAKTEPLDVLLLFVIELCSPSGRVQVVAQGFDIDERS